MTSSIFAVGLLALLTLSALLVSSADASAPTAPSSFQTIKCQINGDCTFSGNGTGVFYKCSNNGDCNCGDAEYCECTNNGECNCDNSTFCNCKGNNGVCQGGNSKNLSCGGNHGMCCYNPNSTALLSKPGLNFSTDEGFCMIFPRESMPIGGIIGIIIGVLAGAVVFILLIVCLCRCCGRCKKHNRYPKEDCCETPKQIDAKVINSDMVMTPLDQHSIQVSPQHLVYQLHPGGYGTLIGPAGNLQVANPNGFQSPNLNGPPRVIFITHPNSVNGVMPVKGSEPY